MILFVGLGMIGSILALIIVIALVAWLLSSGPGTFIFICIILWIIWMATGPSRRRHSAAHIAEQEELHRRARGGER